MARPPSKQPTDGELEILKTLGDIGHTGLAWNPTEGDPVNKPPVRSSKNP
jgi:hypothetical protein